MNRPTAIPGTIVLFSDPICPFTHVAVHRIDQARRELGLDDVVTIDHHAFPIELLNAAPGTRHGSDSEIPALGAIEPDAGWQLWQGPDYHYPNSVLLTLEAVQAAKASGLRASERLDRALRRAFWAESRPIHLHHEIMSLAHTVDDLDSSRLDEDLRSGTARRAVFDDLDLVRAGHVKASPHLFLPDGRDLTNPGLTVHWHGDWTRGFPVIDADDPDVYRDIVTTAAADAQVLRTSAAPAASADGLNRPERTTKLAS
jgi:predicted DsbA family dithiol-disulfide isomerase